jgi:O-antigen/teichoic acid export membrane protein
MLRHTLNHLGVVVASKVMPLASLLVYSRYLEPAEYGVVSLFVSYIWILGIVLTLNLHTPIGRFIYDKACSSGQLIGTTLAPVGVLFTTGVLAASADIEGLARLLNLPRTAVLLLFAVAAGQIAESVLVQVLTAKEHSGALFTAVAGRSLGSLGATVVLLHLLPADRYFAVIYAEVASSVMLVAYLLVVLRRERPWTFSTSVFRSFVSYSIPLIPYMLSLTLLSQFDRVMIDRMFGKEATGLYSVGYNLGILLVMVAGALLNALNPRFFSAMNERRYDDVRHDASAVFAVCTVCAFFLALFGQEAAAFVIPDRYASGFSLIPLIALGGLASVVFQLWGRVVGYTNRTYLLSGIAIAAAVLKIMLNVLLLPWLGIWGGAVTTVIAYGLMATAVILLINTRLDLLKVDVTREVGWLVALAAVVGLDLLSDVRGPLISSLKAAAFVLVAALAWPNARRFVRSRSPTWAGTQ